mgnify:CR=1 FL=1
MSEPKTKEAAAANEAAVLDQLLEGCEKPEDLLAPGGAFNRLRKRLIERVLGTELTVHLGYDKGQKPAVPGNHRNGYSRKVNQIPFIQNRFLEVSDSATCWQEATNRVCGNGIPHKIGRAHV